MLKSFFVFVKGVLSESDGVPSSSRLTMLLRCIADIFAVVILVLAVVRGPLDKATLIIGGLPLILGALGLWTTSTYATNKLAAIFTKPSGEVK